MGDVELRVGQNALNPADQPGDAKAGPSDEELFTQARSLVQKGEAAAAEKLLRQFLARHPGHAGALNELARLAFRNGDKRAALTFLERAIANRPDEPRHHNDLGLILLGLDRRDEAERAFARAIALDPDHAPALVSIGTLHLNAGRRDEAVVTLRRALALDPYNLVARINLGFALKSAVPPWHFPMLNDTPRNALYDQAIRRIVPGRTVLDIGTGAGLLAMMAARADAQWVVSCEADGWIATKAREVLADNGLADRITLVSKPSIELKAGIDMPGRAEVLVTEVFGTTGINEHVLPTVEHAHAHLLQPDAAIIPRAASARGYLAGGPALEGCFFIERAAGFTLTAFNDFAPLKLGKQLDHVAHEVLSEDFEIFRFDLTQHRFAAENRVIEIAATRPGRCCGIVQWLRLELADDLVYENRPGPRVTIDSWGQILYRFAAPIDLMPGDRLRLLAQHDCNVLSVSELPTPWSAAR
jgi:protein arginine N-methyltransferase 7